MAPSRAGVGFSSVMNVAHLLRHVPDQFRGRVFATLQGVAPLNQLEDLIDVTQRALGKGGGPLALGCAPLKTSLRSL